MGRAVALLASLLTACPAAAAVRLAVAPGPLDPAATGLTSAAAARLLDAPRREPGGGLAFAAAAWAPGLSRDERERGLEALRALWGERLSVREDREPARRAPAGVFAPKVKGDTVAAALSSLPPDTDKAGLDRWYDGKRGAAAADPAGRAGAAAAAPAVPAAAANGRRAAAPPPAPAARGGETLSWRRAGVEALKGAGQLVRDLFTWKGLAIAAASLALVTVAPVAIYGLLALGAATAGWTIGKALVEGRAAYEAGDAQGFYAAAREFGRGGLTLGLTLVGARHSPTSLRPHFPRTSGEWRALAAAMDDEPIVVMSLFRGNGEKR